MSARAMRSRYQRGGPGCGVRPTSSSRSFWAVAVLGGSTPREVRRPRARESSPSRVSRTASRAATWVSVVCVGSWVVSGSGVGPCWGVGGRVVVFKSAAHSPRWNASRRRFTILLMADCRALPFPFVSTTAARRSRGSRSHNFEVLSAVIGSGSAMPWRVWSVISQNTDVHCRGMCRRGLNLRVS